MGNCVTSKQIAQNISDSIHFDSLEKLDNYSDLSILQLLNGTTLNNYNGDIIIQNVVEYPCKPTERSNIPGYPRMDTPLDSIRNDLARLPTGVNVQLDKKETKIKNYRTFTLYSYIKEKIKYMLEDYYSKKLWCTRTTPLLEHYIANQISRDFTAKILDIPRVVTEYKTTGVEVEDIPIVKYIYYASWLRIGTGEEKTEDQQVDILLTQILNIIDNYNDFNILLDICYDNYHRHV